nr:sporamin B [Ipomoea batatas]
MKTLALLFFFALSLYLLPNPTHSTFNPIRLPTADEPLASSVLGPIVDADGNELQTGQSYYMTSVIWGIGGGGLKLAGLDSSACPSDVIVSPNSFDLGNPITFTPADPTSTAVFPSTYQSLSFNIPTNKLCQDKLSWGAQYDRRSGEYFMKTGEFVENQSNQFKIEVVLPALNAYKMTYCGLGNNECYNVGRYTDLSSRATRLALSNTPYVVVFKKDSDVFDDKNEGRIGESQTRGPQHGVMESANIVAFVGSELTVSEFVEVKVGIHNLNLELVAIVGDKLAGFQEILPGRAVVLDSPVHVVYAELVGGDVEPESLMRLQLGRKLKGNDV